MGRKARAPRRRRPAPGPGRKQHGPPPPSLPTDITSSWLSYLTWVDTKSMGQVCRHWRQVVHDAQQQHFEWKQRVLDGSHAEIFSRLAECIYTLQPRFEPTWVLVTLSTPPRAVREDDFHTALATLVDHHLISRATTVVAYRVEEVADGEDKDAEVQEGFFRQSRVQHRMSVTVACLPETEVCVTTLDRKELRWMGQGKEDVPPCPLSRALYDPFFMAFSMNATSAKELVGVVRSWGSKNVVGCVASHVEQGGCIYVKRRGGRVKEVESSANVLLSFQGAIGAHAWSACGFQTLSPVMQSYDSTVIDPLAPSLCSVYTSVKIEGRDGDRVVRISELLASMDEVGEDDVLSLYTSPSRDALDGLSEPDVGLREDMSSVRRLHSISVLNDRIFAMEPFWEEDDYGVLCVESREAFASNYASTLALVHAQEPLACVSFLSRGQWADGKEDVALERQLYQDYLWPVPRHAAYVRVPVGPLALPNGLYTCDSVGVEPTSTCGVVFYRRR